MTNKILALAALSFVLTGPSFAAEPSLYKQYSGKTVKVFVDVQDASADHEVAPAVLKTKLEEALAARKSITFKVVPTAEEADLLIETRINGFHWTDHDPVDMLMGVGGTAADAAIVEDYAALNATIVVREVRSKRQLWQDKLIASVTQKPMPKPDSIPLVAEDLAKLFLRECFSKKRG